MRPLGTTVFAAVFLCACVADAALSVADSTGTTVFRAAAPVNGVAMFVSLVGYWVAHARRERRGAEPERLTRRVSLWVDLPPDTWLPAGVAVGVLATLFSGVAVRVADPSIALSSDLLLAGGAAGGLVAAACLVRLWRRH